MKSGNIRDPIGKAIELFEHTLDKKKHWFGFKSIKTSLLILQH